MDKDKVERLNTLFEKVVAESANIIERKELDCLYKEFFEDGRELVAPVVAVPKLNNILAG